jgi:hypothetical protein
VCTEPSSWLIPAATPALGERSDGHETYLRLNYVGIGDDLICMYNVCVHIFILGFFFFYRQSGSLLR